MLLVAAVPPRLEQRFADREEPDHEDHHVDAVEQLRDAEGESRVAGELVDANQTEREAEEQAQQSAEDRGAEQGRDGRERQDRQAEVLRRPEAQRD